MKCIYPVMVHSAISSAARWNRFSATSTTACNATSFTDEISVAPEMTYRNDMVPLARFTRLFLDRRVEKKETDSNATSSL